MYNCWLFKFNFWIFFEEEKFNYDYTCLSIPEFYILNQRKKLKLINESIKMKDVNLINVLSEYGLWVPLTIH